MRGIAGLALVVVSCGAMTACERVPIGPDHRNPILLLSCTPTGSNVECSATLYDVPSFGSMRDVTTEATWTVSDPSLGGFAMPGLFTPIAAGEVRLGARFEEWASREDEDPWFLVGPGTDARWLYFLAGVVYDASTNEGLAEVEVRMLDGYAEGALSTTGPNGHYQFDRVLTGEVFTVEASKEGYSSETQPYRVDPPNGPIGNSPFLDFHLTPLP